MAITHEIKVQRREDEGKGASRRLRHAGTVPAIVYGGELKPVSIQLNHNEVWLASQNDWFYASILDLSLNGDVQKVLLRDLQRHPFKQQIMHMDFQRVNENEALRVSVPLHFLNEEKSPAGKSAEVVVTHELNEVEISCLPKDLPEFIEIDLSALEVGDRHPFVRPEAAGRRRDPGAEAGQGTRRGGGHRQARQGRSRKKPSKAQKPQKYRRQRRVKKEEPKK